MHNRVHIAEPKHQHSRVLRWRAEFQCRLSDKAQDALRTDKEVPKIKARIVLHQTPIELQYFTGTRNHSQACHPFTRHAVANYIDTARIGGNVAANLTRAAGRKIDGIEKSGFTRRRLDGLGDRSRAYLNGSVSFVNRINRIQFIERDNNLTVCGNSTATQPSTTTRGDKSNTLSSRKLNDVGYFIGGSREDNGKRRRLGKTCPILSVAFED